MKNDRRRKVNTILFLFVVISILNSSCNSSRGIQFVKAERNISSNKKNYIATESKSIEKTEKIVHLKFQMI